MKTEIEGGPGGILHKIPSNQTTTLQAVRDRTVAPTLALPPTPCKALPRSPGPRPPLLCWLRWKLKWRARLDVDSATREPLESKMELCLALGPEYSQSVCSCSCFPSSRSPSTSGLLPGLSPSLVSQHRDSASLCPAPYFFLALLAFVCVSPCFLLILPVFLFLFLFSPGSPCGPMSF